MAVSPRYCAEQKVQTGSAGAGGHRRVATRETTGDLATRRGAGDPETRAEWMKVLRYGHLRSAPVVVDVGVRTEWEPPTLRAALWLSTRPDMGASSMAYCLSDDARMRLQGPSSPGHRDVFSVPVPKFERDAGARSDGSRRPREVQIDSSCFLAHRDRLDQ